MRWVGDSLPRMGVVLLPRSATEIPLGDRRRLGASKPGPGMAPRRKVASRSAARSLVAAQEIGSKVHRTVRNTRYGVPMVIAMHNNDADPRRAAWRGPLFTRALTRVK